MFARRARSHFYVLPQIHARDGAPPCCRWSAMLSLEAVWPPNGPSCVPCEGSVRPSSGASSSRSRWCGITPESRHYIAREEARSRSLREPTAQRLGCRAGTRFVGAIPCRALWRRASVARCASAPDKLTGGALMRTKWSRSSRCTRPRNASLCMCVPHTDGCTKPTHMETLLLNSPLPTFVSGQLPVVRDRSIAS